MIPNIDTRHCGLEDRIELRVVSIRRPDVRGLGRRPGNLFSQAFKKKPSIVRPEQQLTVCEKIYWFQGFRPLKFSLRLRLNISKFRELVKEAPRQEAYLI